MKQILLSGRQNQQIVEVAKRYNTKSVFGFAAIQSELYGGRPFPGNQILHQTIESLYSLGIGFDLVLSNHWFTRDAYVKSWGLLGAYHLHGNGVVVTNWKLAEQIRKDFPKYNIKASCIRNPRTLSAIEKGLIHFDQVTLQTNAIKDRDFIQSIPKGIRDRVILFGNSSCLYNCTNATCYPHISAVHMKRKPATDGCSDSGSPRLNRFYWFNYEEAEIFKGFPLIKLVLPRPNSTIIHIDADTGQEIRSTIQWQQRSI